MKSAGKKQLLAVIYTLCLVCTQPVYAAVTASIDRSQITVEDSLTLTFRATEGEDLDNLDLRALDRNFIVGSPSRTTRYSTFNGHSERTSELKLTLVPRRTGRIQIPGFRIAGQETLPFDILVAEASANVDTSRDVFVEAEVSAKEVFVQSQLLHTFRIYEAINLQDRGRSQLEIPDAVVEELDSNSYQRTINGRTYRVIEIKHAIFPQKSGSLVIPAMSFSGRERLARRSFLSLGGGGELLRRRAAEIKVEVKPIPASYPDAPWLPVRKLTLEEAWSTQPGQLQVGDSATRTLTLEAAGIDGNQLPPVEQAPVAGIKLYPDQTRSENTSSELGITGIGINSAALLVTEAGDYRLPAIRIPWWDTESNQLRYAEIPAREFSVAQASLPAGSADQGALKNPVSQLPVATADLAASGQAAPVILQQGSIWLWTTVAALAGWLLTTVYLLRRTPTGIAPTQDIAIETREPNLFRELLRCCEENRDADSRDAIRRWGQSYFGDSAPPSIAELSARLDDEGLRDALAALERSLFGSSEESWSGGQLSEALRRWRKQASKKQQQPKADLPPLYS